MLVKHELIKKVRDYFGMNIYEAKVWLALLRKGIASAGEVASISGVPRSRTYDVLESLEKRGFAIVQIGKPVKYIGVKPRMILEKLKNNVRKNAEEKMVELSKIKTTDEFGTLESLYNVGIEPVKKEDISVALKGKSNISSQIKELIKNAKEEVIICTNVEEMALKSKLFQQTFDVLNKSDVKLKIALSGNEKLIKQVSEKFNTKLKKINVDAKFFIIDRREILFYLSKNLEKEDVAIWLNSEFFSQAFASLFEKAVGSLK
jgi:sugar-specific transcriptional regulator TrmB